MRTSDPNRQKNTYQLMEGDLRSTGIEDEPPGVSEHGCTPDVDANDHVAEEEPRADKRFTAVPRRQAHDRVVGRIEAEGCCW